MTSLAGGPIATVPPATVPPATVSSATVPSALVPSPDVTTARHPSRIRTFHVRRGRVSGRHLDAFGQHWPVYGVRVDAAASMLDPMHLFGRSAPLVVEIGSGMGESTVDMAAADLDRDYLAVEVHPPGVANLLALIAERGLSNLRVAQGDALDLLRHQLAPDSLDAIHIFFPDPWPKSRHQKRRLIQPPHVALMRARLRLGGTVHCATDSPGYAHSMLATFGADDGLSNVHVGYASRPRWRPVTKFELRALDDGRGVFDLEFRRQR